MELRKKVLKVFVYVKLMGHESDNTNVFYWEKHQLLLLCTFSLANKFSYYKILKLSVNKTYILFNYPLWDSTQSPQNLTIIHLLIPANHGHVPDLFCLAFNGFASDVLAALQSNRRCFLIGCKAFRPRAVTALSAYISSTSHVRGEGPKEAVTLSAAVSFNYPSVFW